MSATTGSTSESRPIDANLYSLECGYNLRGLSGDPVRCPECGYRNPLSDAQIPADIITRQLQKMESAPATAVACTLVFSLLVGLVCTAAPHAQMLCFISLFPLPAAAWLLQVRRFRDYCQRRPGWLSAILSYHFYGLVMIVSTIGAFPVALWCTLQLAEFLRLSAPLTALGTLATWCGVAYFWVRWLYRCATAPIRPLQREVAITLAHEETRKRMARAPRRRLFGQARG